MLVGLLEPVKEAASNQSLSLMATRLGENKYLSSKVKKARR